MEHTEQKGWRKFDCEELEDIINDVRSGVKDSAHIHSFVRREIERTLQEEREEMVRRIAQLYVDFNPTRPRLSDITALIKDTKKI